MTVQQKIRLSSRLTMIGTALLLVSCDQSATNDAGAPAPTAVDSSTGVQPAAPTATPTTAATPDSAATAMPADALAAWEKRARSQCSDTFVPTSFTPLSGKGEPYEQIAAATAEGKGGLVSLDVNGDGKRDYALITTSQGCASDEPMSFGRMGPPINFVVSSAEGYIAMDGYNGSIAPAMVRRRGDRDVIEVTGTSFNGDCGQITTVVWGWTGKAMDIIGRRNAAGQRVDGEGCVIGAEAKADARPTKGS